MGSNKEKYKLEFLLKTSPRVLEKLITTPDGLADWFADDVKVQDDIYTFEWDGNEEQARLVLYKMNAKIRFQWLEDEEAGLDTYFELSYVVDPMTNSVILQITDFASSSDKEGNLALWNQAINDLKRIIGA
ncbi:MAG: START-like domain-containing protein [Flavobacteriales bacterium]